MGRESFGQKLFQGGKKNVFLEEKSNISLTLSQAPSPFQSRPLSFAAETHLDWTPLLVDQNYVTAMCMLLIMIM